MLMLADTASPTDATDAAALAPRGPDLASYDAIIVAFSGGKDSLACVLALLEAGVPRERIELWHHDVDGREGSDLMDWPCTRDYCAKVAAALRLPIFFSWKAGGFEREMLRQDARTAPINFEAPVARACACGHAWTQHARAANGADACKSWGCGCRDVVAPEGAIDVRTVGGEGGKASTRRKFPQVSADLSVRWCSAYLKIDVGAAAIRNQERFRGRRVLVLSGERAEESAARAKYKAFEPDRADGRATRYRRHVDRWRPVLAWKEREVWAIIERWRVNPHPAYRLGWGRVSCMTCIFGSPNQWASVKALAPARFERVAQYEETFGVTIQRKRPVRALAVVGQPYRWSPEDARAALSAAFDEPAILEPGAWKLPAGAFGESCGPT